MAEVDQMTPPNLETAKEVKKDAKKAKPKSGLKMNLIVILISQLVLAGGGFLMVSQFIKPDPAFNQALEDEAARKASAAEDSAAAAHAEHAQKQIYLIEDVIVNPAGTRGSRYLSVSIGVEMNAQEHGGGAEGGEGGGHGGGAAEAEVNPLDVKKPQLRDALINILSSKTIPELTTTEEKEKIRQEILTRFTEVLEPLPVYQIYFVDFVLQ
jgi:flagellar FliL protein